LRAMLLTTGRLLVSIAVCCAKEVLCKAVLQRCFLYLQEAALCGRFCTIKTTGETI
jgi:hypothetical protein